MEAVVLVGGIGTRVRPAISYLLKALAPLQWMRMAELKDS